ncbi:hypothetical protein ACJX0J_039702, partial [Zea mays]
MFKHVLIWEIADMILYILHFFIKNNVSILRHNFLACLEALKLQIIATLFFFQKI